MGGPDFFEESHSQNNQWGALTEIYLHEGSAHQSLEGSPTLLRHVGQEAPEEIEDLLQGAVLQDRHRIRRGPVATSWCQRLLALPGHSEKWGQLCEEIEKRT